MYVVDNEGRKKRHVVGLAPVSDVVKFDKRNFADASVLSRTGQRNVQLVEFLHHQRRDEFSNGFG